MATTRVEEGRLDPRDSVTIKGEFYDTHSFSVTPGVRLHIELHSLGFDGFLSVTTPSGLRHRDDETGHAGSTELSRIGPLRSEEGEYTVYVTSIDAGEVGAYDLRVLTFE